MHSAGNPNGRQIQWFQQILVGDRITENVAGEAGKPALGLLGVTKVQEKYLERRGSPCCFSITIIHSGTQRSKLLHLGWKCCETR